MTEQPTSLLGRLWPKQVDNRFGGHRAALWLLGLYIALKLIMSLNSIFNTASVASGADGIPLNSYDPLAARQVLILFALLALGQLVLALTALAALIRYRTLVPFIYLVLLGESLARRAIVISYELGSERAPASFGVGAYINFALLALLSLGLLLSLITVRKR